jgi:hypothetical protein
MARSPRNSTSVDMTENTDAISPVRPAPNIMRPKTAPPIADKAAKFLSDHDQIVFDYEDERALLKRVDIRILPLLLGAYFFQQLDKSSLSYVSIFGLIEDAHLTSRKIFYHF